MKVITSPNGLAEVRFKNALDMELVDGSVDLMVGAGLHVEGGLGQLMDVYAKVYVGKGLPALKRDGIFLCFQDDVYVKGRRLPQSPYLLYYLVDFYELLDRKVWRRKAADFRFPPWTDLYVLTPQGSRASRLTMNKRTNMAFQGVWDYGVGKRTRGHLAWPEALCHLMVTAFTERGDTILDPFTGSGRLLGIAASRGRRAIGYEIDETMAPVIEENLAVAK